MERIQDFSGNLLRAGNTIGLPVFYVLPSLGNAGNVIYFAPEKKVKFWDALAGVWKNLENTAQFQLTNSITPGYELVPNAPQAGPNFVLRQLYPGAGVELSGDDDAITIDTQPATFTLDNVGGGFEFVRNAPQSGTSFTTRNIEAGSGMTVSATSGQVILSLTTMNGPIESAGAEIPTTVYPDQTDWIVLPLTTPSYSTPYFTIRPDSIEINGEGKFIATAWVEVSGNFITLNKVVSSIRIVKRKILNPSIQEIISSESRMYHSIKFVLTNGISVSGVFDTTDDTEEIVLEYRANEEATTFSPGNVVEGNFSVVKM